MFKFWKQYKPHFKPSNGNNQDGYRTNCHEEHTLYFWGFYVGDCLPSSFEQAVLEKFWENVGENEITICYIGKKIKNPTERLMQHFSALFGGYYTIIDWEFIKNNNTQPRLRMLELLWDKFHKLEREEQKYLKKVVLHKSESHHSVRNFFRSRVVAKTVNQMKERLIFTSIKLDENTLKDTEAILHSNLTLNVLGGGGRKRMVRKVGKINIVGIEENRILKGWIDVAISKTPFNTENKAYIGSSVNFDYFLEKKTSSTNCKCSICQSEKDCRNYTKESFSSKDVSTLNLCSKCFDNLKIQLVGN